MRLLVDHFGWFGNRQIVLDYKRMAAIALLAGALYLIYLSNVRRVNLYVIRYRIFHSLIIVSIFSNMDYKCIYNNKSVLTI